MHTFMDSFTNYEAWLKREIGNELFQKDLDEKHRKMKSGTFPFLRATYWRWAETILEICPEFNELPEVLSIGDTHLENFGTWRDVEGRLVWGANDFDDAAKMPYILDVVRLGVSAVLARANEAASVRDICQAIMDGYRNGRTKPEPIILDKEHAGLREALVLKEHEREKFWAKLEKAEEEVRGTQPTYEFALQDALPDVPFSLARRSAGTGSLGRPRFVGMAKWRGGYVVREAKRLVQSAWCLAHRPDDRGIYAEVVAKGRQRSPDPHYMVTNSIVVRRLSPNSRKIDVEDDPELMLSRDMLVRMGEEIANCHTDDTNFAAAAEDFDRRDGEWLRSAVKKIVPIIKADHEEFVQKFVI